MRMLLTIPLTALLIGCGSDSNTDKAGTAPASTPAASAKTVTIADFKFGAPLTVAKGTTVTWTNSDSAPHNVVGDGFKTADLTKGKSDTVTFAKAGTFDYVCTFHPFMKGTVVVR
ncbi:MAG: Amicyanin-alpha [Solirubrobacterales bacterium]|nr:Amicyanin-alpha [Solirubrobacterales bacterium]